MICHSACRYGKQLSSYEIGRAMLTGYNPERKQEVGNEDVITGAQGQKALTHLDGFGKEWFHISSDMDH